MAKEELLKYLQTVIFSCTSLSFFGVKVSTSGLSLPASEHLPPKVINQESTRQMVIGLTESCIAFGQVVGCLVVVVGSIVIL